MSHENEKKILHRVETFIAKERRGKCPYCDNNVYDDQLFVEENEKVYHFSCHNYMKKEENEQSE